MGADGQGSSLGQLLAQPTADDVVGAVFAYTGDPLFSSDRRMLQTFFHQLAQAEEYGSLLKLLHFSERRDLYPFSRVLEDALGRLQMGKLIYAKNPEYDMYGMTGPARETMMEVASAVFTSEERELLARAAQKLRDFATSWAEKADAERGASAPNASSSAVA